MEHIIFLVDLLKHSATHFLFSGFAGVMAFCLIQIISFAAFRIFRGRVQLPLGLNLFMVGLGLLLAFIVAFYAHVWLDGFLDWWVTPLASPFIILK
jgi:hypothetical protein